MGKKDYFANKNVLDALSHDFTKKVVGEQKNIKTAICALISRDLPKKYRFSLIIVNRSSTGKSYFLNTMLEPFREVGDVIDLTYGTDAYLKRKLGNVNGTIIKLEQLESKDDSGKLALTLIKHLMSEGVVKAGIVDQDEHGKKAPVEFEVRGKPIIVTTATSNKIDIETKNRFLEMELDESDRQTELIIAHICRNAAGLGSEVDWDKTVKDLTSFFKELKQAAHMIEAVVIPFTDKIKELLPKNLEMRRDLDKILAITANIAFINYKNRDRLKCKKPEKLIYSVYGETEDIHKGVIIARPDDFVESVEIAGNSIRKTITKTGIKTREIYHTLRKLFTDAGLDATGISLKELVEATGLPENTIRDHMDTLQSTAFVIKDESSREHRYFPLNKKFTKLANTNVKFSPEEYLEWLNKILKTSAYTFVSSCDSPISSDLCLKTAKEVTKSSFVGFREKGESS